MKIISSYKVKIKHFNKIFTQTVLLYRQAVSFFLNVCENEWQVIEPLTGNHRNNYIESITITTKKHPNPIYNFNTGFYKFPSYLRRAAIQEAIGAYSSYKSNLSNWETNTGGKIGKPPTLAINRNSMPTLYKNNMFIQTSSNTAKIKIYHQNDWIWLEIELNQQDINYINRNCKLCKQLNPKLYKSGKNWYLSFPFEQDVKLTDKEKPITEKLICAVDLGLNKNAVCSLINSKGTVIGRKFIDFPIEKDHLNKALGRQKKVQQTGAKKTPIKWKHINDINTEISRKTAKAIVDYAKENGADVIVFEHLDFKGKVKGRKKQRLHLWRKKEVQRLAEHKAHRVGIRISRVCAWGTSRLAYDGSGCVERGSESTHSICIFQTGKIYNADLNASYNIGARYFIREILKSEPVMARLPDEAKVLRYGTGTTRTLSTLIRLNADLAA